MGLVRKDVTSGGLAIRDGPQELDEWSVAVPMESFRPRSFASPVSLSSLVFGDASDCLVLRRRCRGVSRIQRSYIVPTSIPFTA